VRVTSGRGRGALCLTGAADVAAVRNRVAAKVNTSALLQHTAQATHPFRTRTKSGSGKRGGKASVSASASASSRSAKKGKTAGTGSAKKGKTAGTGSAKKAFH
jgi:hypothetical protein